MVKQLLSLVALLSFSNPPLATDEVSVARQAEIYINESANITLSSKSISMEERYKNKSVNDVFKDNILLTLNYMDGRVKNRSDIVWDDVVKPRQYRFELNPGETFAFHDQILKSHNNVVKTTNARFNFQDGFRSSGSLYGDGVCHLASLIYWASVDAGLEAHSPIDHNFANINEVPKEYGVSIYYLPNGFEKSSRENLYITNNLDAPVSFIFNYDGRQLSVDITKHKS